MTRANSARASLLRLVAHATVFLGAFAAAYASGATIELSIVARGMVLATPIGAALVVLRWGAPEGGRTLVRGLILAAGAGFALGYVLGTLRETSPTPFSYGA